jgi:tetratricopeptide (TPR) repeat protein
MRKTIASILTVLAVLASSGVIRAEEPKAGAAKKPAIGERQKQREEAFKAAMVNKDVDKALSVLDEMIADKETTEADRFQASCFQFGILATVKKDGAKACPLAKKLSETKNDDPTLLNELAWTILDTPDLKNRDLDIALAIAQKAAEASKNEDGAILDTLARAHFEKGDLDKAIEIQTKAVEKCQKDDRITDEVKTQVKETLEKYQNKKADKIS